MFRRVLVANRGEIALRVLRACRALDVATVAVYSEADRGAPWLEEADQSVCIGPARAAGSYLNAAAILQAAEQTECQAIHPGYGFLSENAIFAARCEQQGVTFIGPSAASIQNMGDKARAKRTLREAGLQTIPGSEGVLSGVDQAQRVADELGYPVLLKASAGGGGRGMRLCGDASELKTGYAEATLESQQAFGDPSLYLEKKIVSAHHIEFQLLGDGRGGAVHLGERECSIQRKHQKLIEESPSPSVSAEQRSRIGVAVVRAVAACGYRNAGTVEFLLDDAGNFYFMEMNTRLQVEHPVTELVTGVDLVEWQLRLAANQPLTLTQESIEFTGHAMEFRLNAEDPSQGFRPDPGEITRFTPPQASDPGATVRWDSAVREGYSIPPHYDSMVGKLIVHAADRAAVIKQADATLAQMVVEGVSTTIPLHRQVLADEKFRQGKYDTSFLEGGLKVGS